MSKGTFLPLPAVLLIFWLVFFFPRWYVLTYTKIWELRQMVGRGRERQLTVMHPTSMRRLLELRQELVKFDPDSTAVVLPQDRNVLPLAGNAAIVRSILYPYPVFTDVPAVSNFQKVFFINTVCKSEFGESECWEIRP